jgi:hypothetical protein
MPTENGQSTIPQEIDYDVFGKAIAQTDPFSKSFELIEKDDPLVYLVLKRSDVTALMKHDPKPEMKEINSGTSENVIFWMGTKSGRVRIKSDAILVGTCKRIDDTKVHWTNAVAISAWSGSNEILSCLPKLDVVHQTIIQQKSQDFIVDRTGCDYFTACIALAMNFQNVLDLKLGSGNSLYSIGISNAQFVNESFPLLSEVVRKTGGHGGGNRMIQINVQ